MRKLRPHHLTPCLLSVGLICSPAILAGENFSDLFTDAKPILDLRYRYEHIDQDNALKHANAQTLRTRIGFQTGQWYGLSALVEVDNVSRLGDAAYNSTRNGQTDYSTVPDPDGSEINQALLRYDHALGNAVVGRQRINLDNQRFVGGVAWRQNEQTYDGVLGQLQPVDELTLTYAYIDNVNTIFGPGDNRFDNRANPANIEGHSHLINARYVLSPQLTATAYSYLLGLDNIASAPSAAPGTLSSKTTGLRLSGAARSLSYAFEYARQQDYAGNPQELSSEYYLAELGYALKGLPDAIGYQARLSGLGRCLPADACGRCAGCLSQRHSGFVRWNAAGLVPRFPRRTRQPAIRRGDQRRLQPCHPAGQRTGGHRQVRRLRRR